MGDMIATEEMINGCKLSRWPRTTPGALPCRRIIPRNDAGSNWPQPNTDAIEPYNGVAFASRRCRIAAGVALYSMDGKGLATDAQ